MHPLLQKMLLEADDETRLKYHLAATMVNNFTNHLFALAASFCEKENISFAVLQPLIEETVDSVAKYITSKMRKPVLPFRNDMITIQKHRELVEKISGYFESFIIYSQLKFRNPL